MAVDSMARKGRKRPKDCCTSAFRCSSMFGSIPDILTKKELQRNFQAGICLKKGGLDLKRQGALQF